MDPVPLREVRVGVVRRAEEERWNDFVRTRHEVGFRKLCGRHLRHVAVLGEHWLELVGWHPVAVHCAAGDCWIDWTPLQRRKRLLLVINQSRFLLQPEAGSILRLASCVLGRSLRRLPPGPESADPDLDPYSGIPRSPISDRQANYKQPDNRALSPARTM